MLIGKFIKLTRPIFFGISFLSITAVFVLYDVNVYSHFERQILGNVDCPYSIDAIFQNRYLQSFPYHSSNATSARLNREKHPRYTLRHLIFQKDGSKKFGPKRNFSKIFTDKQYANKLNWSLLQKSPYILPSQFSQEGEFFYNQGREHHGTRMGSKTKFITFYNKPPWLDLQITFDKCPATSSDCRMVGTLAQHTAHALVFSIPDLRHQQPPHRPRGQRWVYYNIESPANTNNVTSSPLWRHQFNLTMTYRTDSDVFLPYAYFKERDSPSRKDYESIARGKSRLVAIFVSNCLSVSERLEYVRELQRSIPVDVYGKCGPYKCYSKRHTDCLDILHEQYKFYLSFENSLCIDYVTEKFTKTFRDIDVVPIVRGGADYDMILPRSSYINTAWFSSPRNLALYLQRLDKDERAYADLLRHKDRFIEVDPLPIQRAFCDLCHRLHEDVNADDDDEQYYTDVSKWFRDGACQQPNFL